MYVFILALSRARLFATWTRAPWLASYYYIWLDVLELGAASARSEIDWPTGRLGWGLASLRFDLDRRSSAQHNAALVAVMSH